MEGTIPPNILIPFTVMKDQEGIDSTLQPSMEWGCNEEEWFCHRDNKC